MKCNFQRHSHVTPRFGSAETYVSETYNPTYVSVIPITQFERGYFSLRFLFRSIMLTLNRPGFSESGTAGGEADSAPRVTSLSEDHDHEIW